MSWIDEAIELEATPKAAREITVLDFLKKHGIESSTYYYQMRKPENQKKVLELCLSQAKKGAPEVLEKLREKAEGGSEKSIEMYLKFILALKERADLTTDDKELLIGWKSNLTTPQDNGQPDFMKQ
mgnify:CR=1 FL=1|jgi:hypothetical protein